MKMNQIGICGDNCAYCPRYMATQKGGKAPLEKARELWIRLGLRDESISATDMVCYGCVPENDCAYLSLIECVKAKGLENCGLCDAYPCELLNGVFEKTERLKARASRVCRDHEIDLLQKAFFSKKAYFDRISRKRKTPDSSSY